MNSLHEHYCQNPDSFPIKKFFQNGIGQGQKILFVGESPAGNGWRMSGQACYTPDGKLLPTGQRLNELLETFNLSVSTCGFTELSKCYIGKNRELLKSCSQKCWPIFLRQLKTHNCQLLVILGVHTTSLFNSLSGYNLQVGKLTKITLQEKSYAVLPIYHPSPINPFSRQKNKEIFELYQKNIQQLL